MRIATTMMSVSGVRVARVPRVWDDDCGMGECLCMRVDDR